MRNMKLIIIVLAMVICAFSVDCQAGELSGIGGDGNPYTAQWTGADTLRPTAVYAEFNGQPFIHFTLNDTAWPSAGWGIEQGSWSATCADGGSLSGIGGDGNRYTAQWTGAGTLRPTAVYAEYIGQPFIHFTLNDTAWPSAEWGIAQGSWSITCGPLPTGELSGIGGDGNRYTAQWTGSGKLRPTAVYAEYIGQPFIHFTLDDIAWPSAEWGIAQGSWSVTCATGGRLSGIGGDGNRYTERWTGTGTLRPTAVYAEFNGQPFIHFTLNDAAWPSAGWGIEQGSWSLICMSTN